VAGFAWRHVRIVKIGDSVIWYLDGHVMATLDLTIEGTPSGTNILFGQGDPNATSPADPAAATLDFGLIDNVRVIRE
jgi:prepilin-type processing-associated H-X9-DG protein